MFVIKKLIPSISIEGNERNAGIIYINTKNNIIEDIEEVVNIQGGLAHATPGGVIALFLDPNENELVKVANQILQKTKELGLRSKIGINSGKVIIEEIPGQHIKYASLGNATSVAKKIAVIENGIIISDELHKRIGKDLRAEKRGDGWFVKGFADPKYLKY
jgi:ribosomal protein L10